jgi:glutamate carboxypeptidase
MTLSASEQAVCSVIAAKREALLTQLAGHVAIPTGLHHAPGLDQYRAMLVERLEAIGAVIERIEGDAQPIWLSPPDPGDTPGGAAAEAAQVPGATVVAARKRTVRPTPRVLLVGHIDTVHDPHGPFQQLTIQPDRRTAIGPGAVDMKGGILIALAALEALHELGVGLHWTFVLNSDEETGSFQSERILRAEARRHDVGLVFEPALPGGALAIERMGSGQFMIEVYGRAAHVGRDFATGISAVSALGEIIVKLSALARPDQGMIVNVGPLRGGAATNIVADHAACWGNVRFSDPQRGRALADAIDALATKERPGTALPRVVVHRHWNRPAKPTTPAVERLALAARTVAEDLGQTLPFTSTGGVCDGNNLQDAGLPTIDTLGLRGGNLHRLDEFIELPSIVERCQLIAVLLMRIAAGAVTQDPPRGP